MKYLLVILIVLLSISAHAQKDTSNKLWYYMWTANVGSTTAWGENTLKDNHKPTKAEIIKHITSFAMSKKDPIKKYIKIEDLISFGSEEEYYKWKEAQNQPMKAYEIYLTSHH